MKRKIICAFIFLACFFAFSDGYRKTYWGESILELVKNPARQPVTAKNGDYDYLAEPARLLGQPTTIYYSLLNQRLIGISYSVKDTPESRQKINDLISSYQLKQNVIKYIDWSEESASYLKKQIASKNLSCDILFVDDILGYNRGLGSLTGNELIDNGKGESKYIYINADYNYNTEVHIYMGIVHETICVVYTEKAQDF